MAKSLQKIQAVKLRKAGKSMLEIAKLVGVSKSTASVWCRDIPLEKEQILALQKKIGWGRMKGSKLRREKRLKEIVELEQEGQDMVGNIQKDHLLFLGAGLYWGEGVKSARVGISNSDPNILIVGMAWLAKIWGIKKSDLIVRIGINEIHIARVLDVEKYWSKTLDIPLSQFSKTTLIKARNKKIYSNFNEHYGTAMIRVRKSKNLLHRIKGLISCLSNKTLLSS